MPPRLHLLGTPRLLGADGEPVAGRAAHRRRLALLAYLAAQRGRPVPRERLAALLWPDATDARHALNDALSVLRRELDPELFATAGEDVSLLPERLPSDYDDFLRSIETAHAAGALAAYGGPFLDAFVVEDAPDFARWMDEERGALATAFARVLEAEARRRDRDGDRLGAVEAWRRLAAHDPFTSRIAVGCAEALAAAGDPAAGLRHLQVHEALLREELSLAPPDAVAEARERLRCGAVAPPPAAAAPAPAPAPPAPGAASAVPAPAPTERPPVGEIILQNDARPADPHVTVWLAAPSPGSDAEEVTLRRLARRVADRAGGEVTGVVEGAVRAAFPNPRAATSAAVALLRAWEGRRQRGETPVAVCIGMDHGRAGDPALRAPDEATLRASVLRVRAEPGTIVTTGAVAREAGPLAGVTAQAAGAAVLPGDTAAEPLVALKLVERRRGAAPAPAEPPSASGIRRPGRRWIVALTTVAMLGAMGAWWLLIGRGPERVSIAVQGCPANTSQELIGICNDALNLTTVSLEAFPGLDLLRPTTAGGDATSWRQALARNSTAAPDRVLVVSGTLMRLTDAFVHVILVHDLERETLLAADSLSVQSADLGAVREEIGARASLRVRRVLRAALQAGGSRSPALQAYLEAESELDSAKDAIVSGKPAEVGVSRVRLERAAERAREAERLAPDDVGPIVLRSRIAMASANADSSSRRGHFLRQALLHATTAVERFPAEAAGYEQRARVLFALSDLPIITADSAESLVESAMRDAQRADRGEPRPSLLLLQSDLEFYRGNFEKGLLFARDASESDSFGQHVSKALDAMFHSALSSGYLTDAEEVCDRARRERPDELFRWDCRLHLLSRADRPDTAAAAALYDTLTTRVQADSASDPVGFEYMPITWRFRYATVLARAGYPERARQEFAVAQARAVRLADEEHDSILFDKAHFYTVRGNIPAARAALDSLIVKRPNYRAYVRREAIFQPVWRADTIVTRASGPPPRRPRG